MPTKIKWQKAYKIQNINEPRLFWSNKFGYITRRDATIFTVDQKNSFNLPIEGRWKEIKLEGVNHANL